MGRQFPIFLMAVVAVLGVGYVVGKLTPGGSSQSRGIESPPELLAVAAREEFHANSNSEGSALNEAHAHSDEVRPAAVNPPDQLSSDQPKPFSEIQRTLFDDNLPDGFAEQQRQRMEKIKAGVVIEESVRNFDDEMRNIRGELRSVEDVVGLLTKPPSTIGGSSGDLELVGVMPYGSRRGAQRDGAISVYSSGSLGTVALVEYDTAHVKRYMPLEIINEQVGGSPASLVKTRDPKTGDVVSALSWTSGQSAYSLRVARVDEVSLAQLRNIALEVKASGP